MGTAASSAADLGISIRELLDFSYEDTQKWFEFFRQNPKALDVELGGAAKDVRGLVLHIITVELRYVERLLGQAPRSFDAFRGATFEQMQELFAESRRMIDEVLSRSTPESMSDVIVSQTKAFGEVRASKRKVLVHMMLHGMRHWAQLAMALRQAGFATGTHDLIFSKAMQ